MSHSAKILPFPSRLAESCLSPRDAELRAREFLAIPLDEKTDSDRQTFLCSPDVLLSICSLLRRNRDLAPGAVFCEAATIYQWISRPGRDLGLFDERDYFLGETALVAGGASRLLGKREEAFLWLD